MDAEVFAKWLRRQGYTVLRTESSYWYAAGPRVYQAFPYHWLIQPSQGELRRLMLSHGIAALRYSTPLNAPQGMVSYHAVLHAPYTLEMLRHQARNGVRKGLKCFQVERISFQRLADEGWALQQDTLERQGRARSMAQETWRRLCLAAEGLPGFEAWGALHESLLAAALLIARVDDICCVPYAASRSQFLSRHVNNALFFTVSCDVLARQGVTGIFFSLHSLDAPESVDEFKFRMGIQAKAVRQRVVFHPFLRPLISRPLHRAVLYMQHRRSESPLLSKAEGMLRFYLQGRRPLEQQEWPECVALWKERTFAGAGVLTERSEGTAQLQASND